MKHEEDIRQQQAGGGVRQKQIPYWKSADSLLPDSLPSSEGSFLQYSSYTETIKPTLAHITRARYMPTVGGDTEHNTDDENQLSF